MSVFPNRLPAAQRVVTGTADRLTAKAGGRTPPYMAAMREQA